MQILLLSMPDSFEHTPALAIRMPNGALSSLAGNVDPHHRVAVADLVLVQSAVRRTVERLVRDLQPDLVGLSVMTFQRATARRIVYDGTIAVTRSAHLAAEDIEFMRWKAERWMKVRHMPAGTATAKKVEDGELTDWSDDVKVDAGRAFAGFGFTLATKALRQRLMRGEHVELQAVGFSPKPRVVTVEISYGGLDRVPMGGRVLRGERYIVHPKLPLIADLFVNVPDAHIWLTSPAPAAFLRWEGPLAEPGDPITRVDLLPGSSSGPATPVATTGRHPAN